MGDLYLQHEYLFSSSQLILAMLGMGATLRVADFLELLRVPRALLLGLALQLVAVPLLAFLLGRAFQLSPGLAVGLVLVAAVPGGTMSNILTHFAKGHVPLSISLTAVTTVGALFTTPLLLGWLAAAHLPGELEMPVARIAREIALCLLGPLSLGMLITRRLPTIAPSFSRTCIRASLAVIVLIVVGAASADRVDPVAQGAAILAIIALFGGLSLALGYGAARAAGLGTPESVAICIETSYRNTSLALLVKASVFPAIGDRPDPLADDVFYLILMYGAVALPIATIPLVWHRRVQRLDPGSG